MADQFSAAEDLETAATCISELTRIEALDYRQEPFRDVRAALSRCGDTEVAEHVLRWARSGRLQVGTADERPMKLNDIGGGVEIPRGTHGFRFHPKLQNWEFPQVSDGLMQSMVPNGSPSLAIRQKILRWFLGDWIDVTRTRQVEYSQAASLTEGTVSQNQNQDPSDNPPRPDYTASYYGPGGTRSVLSDGTTSDPNTGVHPSYDSASAGPRTAGSSCLTQGWVEPATNYEEVYPQLTAVIKSYREVGPSDFFVGLRNFLNTPGLPTRDWLEMTRMTEPNRGLICEGIGFKWLVEIFQNHQDRKDMENVAFRVLCMVASDHQKKMARVEKGMFAKDRLEALGTELNAYAEYAIYQDAESVAKSSRLSLIGPDFSGQTSDRRQTAGSASQTQNTGYTGYDYSASFQTNQYQ